MTKEEPELTTEILAETDQYQAWRVQEPDGEMTYHLELNSITVHFFKEEWDEFLKLMKPLIK